MLTIVRTNSDHPDFIGLVKKLDAFLAQIDGEEHAFYAQLNKTNSLKHVIVVYDDGVPVGCGAIREVSPDATEVKRMYTEPAKRGQGIAARVLSELEKWAAELSYRKCILETGIHQPEAIRLYTKSGYKRIPNYGKYLNMENSLCFEKELVHG